MHRCAHGLEFSFCERSMVRRGSADAQRAPDRIDGERADFDGGVEHRAQHDLGLALAVQAQFAQFEKHFVDPAGRDLTDALSAESGNDEIAQHALVLIDRGPVEPLLGSNLRHPEID